MSQPQRIAGRVVLRHAARDADGRQVLEILGWAAVSVMCLTLTGTPTWMLLIPVAAVFVILVAFGAEIIWNLRRTRRRLTAQARLGQR